MRLVTDVIRFCAAEMPRFHPVSVSGYHIREAGSTAAQELAFTLANGFAYVEAARAAGLAVDEFAPRLSFFFNAHIDFFEEIAKYRAARRIWATWMRDRYGATEAAVAAAALPHPDGRRVAHRPAARAQHRPHRHRGVGRGARRHPEPAHQLHGRGAAPCPTEKAARIALRTQQVIAHETGVATRGRPARRLVVRGVADRRDGAPGRGGLRPPRRARATARCSTGSWPGSRPTGSRARSPTPPTASSARCPPTGWSSSGVNGFTGGNEESDLADAPDRPRGRGGPAQAAGRGEASPVARRPWTRPWPGWPPTPPLAERNLMPAIFEAVRAYATVGEIVGALAGVFGRWEEPRSSDRAPGRRPDRRRRHRRRHRSHHQPAARCRRAILVAWIGSSSHPTAPCRARSGPEGPRTRSSS